MAGDGINDAPALRRASIGDCSGGSTCDLTYPGGAKMSIGASGSCG